MLNGTEIDLVEEISSQYKDKNDLVFDILDNENEILGYLNNSQLMKDYDDVNIFKTAKISDSVYDAYILVVQVSYTIHQGKFPSSYSEPQVVGLKKLSRNYGNIFIRPETFEDKVSELFIKSEIDFSEFPNFSFRYYCLANDEIKARLFANSDRLRSIEKQNKILIDVNEDVLISKFSRILTYDDFNSMIEFIKKL
jgi:hypothetical protein